MGTLYLVFLAVAVLAYCIWSNGLIIAWGVATTWGICALGASVSPLALVVHFGPWHIFVAWGPSDEEDDDEEGGTPVVNANPWDQEVQKTGLVPARVRTRTRT